MNTTFSCKDFFSLENFAHKELFERAKYVWEVLIEIDSYLASFSARKIDIDIPSFVHLENREQISIGEGTVIEPGVYIQGPCIIGKNCHLRQGAYIREGVICGNECVIGHGTEVKSSLLLNGVKAAHFAYVGNSLLGNDVNLGAGAVLANLRLDRKEIFIRNFERKISTSLTKLGAILADYVQIGCNSTLNPGTIIGKNSLTYPGLTLFGVYPQDSIVKRKEEIMILKQANT